MRYKHTCKNCNIEWIDSKKDRVYCSNKCKYSSNSLSERGKNLHNFCTLESNKKSSNTLKLKYASGELINHQKGKPLSKETKLKISIAKKGLPAWNKGLKLSPEHIQHLKDNHWSKRMIMSDEWIKKSLRRRDKSTLEIKFEDIINENNLPYKFVGNGSILIAKKNPDFIHNSEKIAIEVYYKKHKEKFRCGLEDWKNNREKIFKENGWDILFFDETQVNKNTVLSVLGV